MHNSSKSQIMGTCGKQDRAIISARQLSSVRGVQVTPASLPDPLSAHKKMGHQHPSHPGGKFSCCPLLCWSPWPEAGEQGVLIRHLGGCWVPAASCSIRYSAHKLQKMPHAHQRGQKAVLLSPFLPPSGACIRQGSHLPASKRAGGGSWNLHPPLRAGSRHRQSNNSFRAADCQPQGQTYSPISYSASSGLLVNQASCWGGGGRGQDPEIRAAALAVVSTLPTLQPSFLCRNALPANLGLPSPGRKDKREPTLHGVAGG